MLSPLRVRRVETLAERKGYYQDLNIKAIIYFNFTDIRRVHIPSKFSRISK